MEEFKIRTYTKKELALLYFPDSTPQAAGKHLKAWIQRNKPLMDDLAITGYQSNSKSYNPRQVKIIIDYLGEP